MSHHVLGIYLQYIDVSAATIEERLVQRLVVVEIDESCKLLEGHVAVAVCIHFLHQQLQVFVAHLSRAKAPIPTAGQEGDRKGNGRTKNVSRKSASLRASTCSLR